MYSNINIRSASNNELAKIIDMLADDELGQTRECKSLMKDYINCF
jgi:hypothetical protein